MLDNQFYISVGVMLGVIVGCLFADWAINNICSIKGTANLVFGAIQCSIKD